MNLCKSGPYVFLDCLTTKKWYIYIYKWSKVIHDVQSAQISQKQYVHELPQSHCGDNREGTLFS